MEPLRGVIFSLSDVIVTSGGTDAEIFKETVKLLRFLIDRGIQPVFVSNKHWYITSTKEPFAKALSNHVGYEIPAFEGGKNMPYKPQAAAMEHVLAHFGWTPQNAIYVGNTQTDMQTASNGGLLFLNAEWHSENSSYGFKFSSPKDVARFIDCCCLTPADWFWGVRTKSYQCFSIAPLGEKSITYPEAAVYSTDAKNVAKFGIGDIQFWGLLMAARLHFSGIGAMANYIAPYPGHKTTSEKAKLLEAVKIAGGALRAQYLQDFIMRHTDAPKSQQVRNNGGVVKPENQLSTIHLRRDPLKTGPAGRRYVKPPNVKDKTVLVVDDICTEGNALESARMFLEAAGAKVIGVTWLKTPGSNYYQMITNIRPKIDKPFEPYKPANVTRASYPNNGCIINGNAPKQIAEAFTRFQKWKWPS